MKKIKVKLLDTGNTIVKTGSLVFNYEDNSTEIVIETQLDGNYIRTEIVGENIKTIRIGKDFTLSKNLLEQGDLLLQVVYESDKQIIKWQPFSIKQHKSLNVLNTDTRIVSTKMER